MQPDVATKLNKFTENAHIAPVTGRMYGSATFWDTSETVHKYSIKHIEYC